ncbi:MAG: DUF58 domain-containing protein [Jatrophihabitantaceae bacterium]
MASGRTGFTTRASCLLAAGGTALACGLLLGIVDLARAGVLALAVPLLSALIVLRSRVLIANRRSAEPPRAVSGDTVVMHLTISNRSLLPIGSLMLEDQLPNQMRGNARFVLDGLFSRESRTVSYRMPRLPRGRYRAGPLHIRLTDPFHLVDVRRSFSATSEIVVAPIVERLRGVEPPRSMDVGENAGSHSIGAHGADDASTREYRTGDDLRKIHWRSSARTGALMVRQEERPWQGQLTVLLDTRAGAHANGPAAGPVAAATESDERQRSSFEWAVSAAATVATYGVVNSREVGLITDVANPVRLPMISSGQVADHLAVVRTSARPSLEPLDQMLAAVARESTLIAVLGELDSHSLRMLAGVHPRATSTGALALVLDTGTWRDGPGGAGAPTTGRVAQVLRAAGWRVHLVRCGDSVAHATQLLLEPDAARSSARTPGLSRAR